MKIAAILFFFCSLSLQAQFHVNGIIKDFNTKKALPFASISNKNGISTIADVDGKFNFLANSQQETLTISYVGYEPKTITTFETNSFFTIYLLPKIVALDEVAISNANSANVIMARVILKKQNNNLFFCEIASTFLKA